MITYSIGCRFIIVPAFTIERESEKHLSALRLGIRPGRFLCAAAGEGLMPSEVEIITMTPKNHDHLPGEQSVDRIMLELSRLGEKVEGARDEIENVKEVLTGNGDPSRGLIVRMDRIEQNAKRSAWLIRTALGAGLTSTAAALVRLLIKGS